MILRKETETKGNYKSIKDVSLDIIRMNDTP